MEVYDYLGNPLVWLLLFLEVIIPYNFASFDVTSDILGLKIMLVRGLVKLVSVVAYHSCLNTACNIIAST